MKYNFDEIIPRRGTNSVKWDLATDERVLPMWVADMDFRAAPPVLDALERRLYEGPRRLFRSRERVVRQTARIPHRKRVDPPDYGRHSRPFGHPEGPDRTGRQGNPSDARLQLFLRRAGAYRPSAARQSAHQRERRLSHGLRRSGTQGGGPAGQADLPVQSPQPGGPPKSLPASGRSACGTG